MFLATGQRGEFSLLVRGLLGDQAEVAEMPLPHFEVLDAKRQRGEIVIQVDPAFDLHVTDRKDCPDTSLDRLSWLRAEQRDLAQLALSYSSPNYAAVLQLKPREPVVRCTTITNIRVTETVVEETVLLDFSVAKAGIREISFLLPASLKGARITVPMLRRKTVEPTAGDDVRVRLTLQDELMDRLRVLVENDRLLTPGIHPVPIPVVETGHTWRQYVALENAGRDEVLIAEAEGLDPLTRQQKEWRSLAGWLGEELTHAYLVSAASPRLSFKTRQRVPVETVGARIGLAQTVLVVDDQGACRAAQTYRIDNRSEAFLEVELPAGAELWSAFVAGQPVKPARVAGTSQPRRVRIPLIKTAPGDLDYEVVLGYGGTVRAPGGLHEMDFPLMRTVNVAVELSHVSVYLPESYRWFDFGGTTRQVFDEGELAAGFVRYQTRVAERLGQSVEAGSAFARARAITNIETIKSDMGQFRAEASDFAHNERLRQEFETNTVAVQWADQQIQDRGPVQWQRQFDNRDRLNELYEGATEPACSQSRPGSARQLRRRRWRTARGSRADRP